MSFPNNVPSNTDLPTNYVTGNVLPATVVNEGHIDIIGVSTKIGTGSSTPATAGYVLTAGATAGTSAWAALPASSASVTLTGDVTGTSSTGNVAATLAASGVTAGTYNYSTITVDAKGRVTSASTGTAPIAPRVSTLTYASTITVPAAVDVARVILTGNPTITFANGTFDGQKTELHIIQDSTGSRTVTWNTTTTKFASTLASPTLSTAANAEDIVVFRWDATTTKWRYYGSIIGF